jgi:hypothetical protein
MESGRIREVERRLTAEDYEDLEGLVHRHHEHLIEILEILRSMDRSISQMERRARGGAPPGARY